MNTRLLIIYLINYIKSKGPLYFTILWFAYQSYIKSKDYLIKTFYKTIRNIPLVNNKIENIKKDMNNTFEKSTTNIFKLPQKGMQKEQILNLIDKLPKSKNNWKDGKISGTVYDANTNLTELINNIINRYQWSNPLHADLFPQIREMEASIVSFCIDLYEGDKNVCGTVTTGGTESIILSCKSHRDYYKKNKNIIEPEIIAPVSVHVAFDKACHYLGIKLIKIPVYENGLPSLLDLEEKINDNTILLVGSAPSFPHGVIDPIEEMSNLALKYNIGLHMDACLGGFILPFIENNIYNFNLNGITSISLDTHKYGYGPKGGSVVLYKNMELVHSQYHVVTDWPGGIYVSPSIPGSRNGSIIAGTWAAMLYNGKKGYTDKMLEIFELKEQILQDLNEIKELEVIGNPESTIIALRCSKDFPKNNIYLIYQYLTNKGWSLNSLQFPPSFHICLTSIHCQQDEDLGKIFINDLKEGIQDIKNNPDKKASGMASIYGTSQSIPDRSIIEELSFHYQDLYYKLE